MLAGSTWVLNNSIVHGTINHGATARLHLILDLPDVASVRMLLDSGTPSPGEPMPELLAMLSKDPMAMLTSDQRRNLELMARFEL